MDALDKHIPLEIVHLTGYTSPNSHALSTLMYCLERSDPVRAYGFSSSHDEVLQLLTEGKVNTVSIDLMYFTGDGLFPSDFNDTSVRDAHDFISTVRAQFPPAVIVLYTPTAAYEQLCRSNPKYAHYFFLSEDNIGHFSGRAATAFERQLTPILSSCEEWFFKFFQYDAVISYAGEDRHYAEALAAALGKGGTRVFYDRLEHNVSTALGRDLTGYLAGIYKHKARLCLVLVSHAYAKKRWTMVELGHIRERLALQPGTEYVVPIRIDDTSLPGIPDTTVYLDMASGVEKIAALVERKLWILDRGEPKNRLTGWW